MNREPLSEPKFRSWSLYPLTGPQETKWPLEKINAFSGKEVLSVPRASAYNAYSVIVPANKKECFYETLEKDDRLDLSFQVGDGGNLDIDFWITNPEDRLLFSVFKKSTSSFGFNADSTGTYVYCFGNQMSSHTDKDVTFTVAGPDEIIKLQERYQMPDDDAHEPLAQEITTLANALQAIEDEQAYMKNREARPKARRVESFGGPYCSQLY
ncbi:p24 complex component [Rhizophlyctis rosea]|nr:p24 complex component [Rhizophlyctis rosea]